MKFMEYLGTGGPESSEGSIAGRGEEDGDSPGESGPDYDDGDDDHDDGDLGVLGVYGGDSGDGGGVFVIIFVIVA